MSTTSRSVLTDAQLRAEVERCEYCATKPCRSACPAACSPADFIMAVRVGAPADFGRAAAAILAANPLGGVCGEVCPDTHCQAACSRAGFDAPVNIPAVQATIVHRARELGVIPEFSAAQATGRRVAVVGGGPAGLAAAAVLGQLGHTVDVLESTDRAGGMAGLIPPFRLRPEALRADLDFVTGLGAVTVVPGARVLDPRALLANGYAAVVVATGLDAPLALGIEGEELAATARAFLANPAALAVAGRRVAVVGGGAVAADCAEAAAAAGAASVTMLALESGPELPLTGREREALRRAGVHVDGRVRVAGILAGDGGIAGLRLVSVSLPPGADFAPSSVADVPGSERIRPDVDVVVVAIGAHATLRPTGAAGVFFAGDVATGPTTVVEAVAAGKAAAAEVDAFLAGRPGATPSGPVLLRGHRRLPVPLDTDFFGIPTASPLLLSAAPPTDGYAAMRRAYEAGWAGGVMKTAFDGVPIHVPDAYMVAFSPTTFANCDNVSSHPLDQVCREVEQLRREYPDRLTAASTGGPVTGRAEADAEVWRSNTRKLEAAGACAIEYSLSCPQGGDGTEGDIVSQNAALTAAIVRWVLEGADPAVPKLFKLTAAVTSIGPIVAAVRAVLEDFPVAKAGVTLANTFPTLAFRARADGGWDEGIVVGMSGDGVAPISYLTVANVSGAGVVVSGNGGVMDYRAAARFLALGARSVQLCSAVMKYGVEIVDELHEGLSHLMAARGMRSVAELVGCALPSPVTPFEDLPAGGLVSALEPGMCVRCGNCTRCPYQAIALDADGFPVTDAARCVGCSFCTLQCFAGALSMRPLTAAEAAARRRG